MEETKKVPSRWTLSKPVKRRSSLFGETFNCKDRITSTEPNLKEATERYHKQITEEVKEWDNLLIQKSVKLGHIEQTQLVADETVLTEESSNYIRTGMEMLQEYVRGLEDTKRLLNFYLEERMVLLETKNDIITIFNQIADEETANIIEDTFDG